jgi:hypothetical protein
MDKQPSKRHRLAATTLSYKDEMERGSRFLPPAQSAPLTEEIVATEPEPILTLPIAKRGFGSRPAQSAPLTEEVVAPVEIQPTSAPTFDGSSNFDSRGVFPEGYDYGARYGGRQSTRFNSSLVNDDKAEARTEWRYQSHRQSAQTPVSRGPYTSAYPSAQGSSLCASFDESQRESQAFPALDRIERIIERMKRHQAASTSASTTSSARFHSLPGQGKFSLFLFEILNCLKITCSLVFFSIERRVLSLYTYGKYLGGRRYAGGSLHLDQA